MEEVRFEARASSVAKVENFGLWKKDKKKKEQKMEDARFLYFAKVARDSCIRLAWWGGYGFRMRACRLVVYLIINNSIS